MDSKQIKFLQLFGELANIELEQTQQIKEKLVPIIQLDFDYGLDIWEYLTRAYCNKIAQSVQLSEFVGQTLLQTFHDISQQKTINAILETESLSKFVFEHNPSADKDIALDIVQNAILTNRQDLAHLGLSGVQKNTRVAYDHYLKTIIEHTITQAIKKLSNAQKNIVIPKKQAVLLLEYVIKVKGSNRALLEQRIKEVS